MGQALARCCPGICVGLLMAGLSGWSLATQHDRGWDRVLVWCAGGVGCGLAVLGTMLAARDVRTARQRAAEQGRGFEVKQTTGASPEPGEETKAEW